MTWRSKLMLSSDEDLSWGPAIPLPEPYLGPIKNKALEIEEGLLLCPSSSEHDGWKAHMERYRITEDRWLGAAPVGDPDDLFAIQPTLLCWSEDCIQALCRTQARVVAESWSNDGFNWRRGPVLEGGVGEYSYPAVIQAADGRIHVTYTYDRIGIRHVELDPDELE